MGRIAFFDVGGVEIQAVESGTVEPALASTPAILLQQNLRLDHFTPRVDDADADAFTKIRDNLVRLGASSGDVSDFQGAGLLAFTDPDGHVMEVITPTGVPDLG